MPAPTAPLVTQARSQGVLSGAIQGMEAGAGGRLSMGLPGLALGPAPESCGPCRRGLGHLWSGEPNRADAGRPETAMTSRSAGLRIALAAIMVQAPRLVLVVLGADRLPVAAPIERALLVVAGVGTALVLTGGNLYLAQTVAQVKAWRRTLAAAWVLVLAASGGLVLPLIVAGISARSVPQVLGAGRLEWTWALLAAIAHELTAAGCVLASAAWAAQAGGAGTGTAVDLFTAGAALPAGREAPLPSGAAAAALLPQPAADRIACRAGCGRSFVSQQAEIAHLRHCPRRRPGSGTGPAN
jgi:hypothetical protein